MRKLIKFLLCFAIITATFQKTFWYVGGIRIYLFQVIAMVFIFIYGPQIFHRRSRFSLVSYHYLALKMVFFFACLISALLNALHYDLDWGLFTKWAATFLFNLIFTVFSINFISKTADKEQLIYPLSILLGCLCSIVYAYIQMTCFKFFHFNIDSVFLERIFSTPWYLGGDLKFGQIYRVSGLLVDPNHLGIVICMSIGIVIAVLRIDEITRITKRCFYVLGLILLVALANTLSRSSLIAFLVSVFILLLFTWKWSVIKYMWKGFVVAVIPSFLFIGIFYIMHDELVPVIIYKLGSSNIEFRISLIMDSLYMWGHNTFSMLFGVGPNCWSIAYYKMTGVAGYNSHSIWLTVLSEVGLIGLVSYLIIYVYILLRSRMVIRFAKHDYQKKLAMSYFAVLCGVIVANLFYITLSWFYGVVFEALMLGLCARFYKEKIKYKNYIRFNERSV